MAVPESKSMSHIIALHGDFATAEMLRNDVGDLRNSIDFFFDARGWKRFYYRIDRLAGLIAELDEPPILIGYSRGGSAIALLSEYIDIRAAVVYESPVIDSEGVGGSFPVLQIWNDAGARFGENARRRGQAIIAEQIWSASHPVTMLIGKGLHVKRNPIGHGWDTILNQQIRDWIKKCMNTAQ
jgi:pimeloyl-ACP methyl ester carboxylesterase